MPQLVRMYIRHVLIGFAISAAFVVGLIGFDVAGLRHLVLGSSAGHLAGFLLFMANGIVFSGVQFGIAVMSMAEDDEPRRPGRKRPIGAVPVLATVPAKARKPRR